MTVKICEHVSVFNFYSIYFVGLLRTLPVAQLLSQSHDSNSIRSWLSSWFTGLKKPDEVIIDQSEALIIATVQTFTQCASINYYINVCMEACLKNSATPSCFIRLDRSHFIHSVHNNKVIRKLSAPVKKLVLGVIGYIVLCDSMDIVEDVLHKLFTLIKNPMGTEEVSVTKIDLSNLVRTHMPMDENYEMEPEKFLETNNANDFETIGPTYKDTLTYKWANGILTSIEIREEEDCLPTILENIYYSEQLQEYLLHLLVRIPMWSNVMCGIFDSSNYTPSSSASESQFKNLKKLSGIKTKLVNVFVDHHLTSLRGFMKIELCEQNHRAKRKISFLDDKNDRMRSSSLPRISEAREVKDDSLTAKTEIRGKIFRNSHSTSDSESAMFRLIIAWTKWKRRTGGIKTGIHRNYVDLRSPY